MFRHPAQCKHLHGRAGCWEFWRWGSLKSGGCVYFITLSAHSAAFTASHLQTCTRPQAETLSPFNANLLLLLPLARGLLLWVSMALTTLKTPWEWLTQCSCHSAVSWRMSWTAPGVRIPSLVKSEWFTRRWAIGLL